MALTWLHMCDSETSHSESAPPTGRAPQNDWEVCIRWLVMTKRVYNGQQWAKQSKPLFLQGSKHWLALHVLQYRSLDQNLWLDLVQHQWSTMTQLHVRGCFYEASRLLLFRKKAMRRTGCSSASATTGLCCQNKISMILDAFNENKPKKICYI